MSDLNENCSTFLLHWHLTCVQVLCWLRHQIWLPETIRNLGVWCHYDVIIYTHCLLEKLLLSEHKHRYFLRSQWFFRIYIAPWNSNDRNTLAGTEMPPRPPGPDRVKSEKKYHANEFFCKNNQTNYDTRFVLFKGKEISFQFLAIRLCLFVIR